MAKILGSLRFFTFLLPFGAFAVPPTLDIGVFAIDDYWGNGGGVPNLSFQIAAGQNFFQGALTWVPRYAGSATRTPSLAQDARNTQVTKAAISFRGGNSIGQREYNDFIFYGGHGRIFNSGNNAGLWLGGNPDYGSVEPGNLRLGSTDIGVRGYNRYFLANACVLFKTSLAPAVVWHDAFEGLRAMLGFRSVIYDNDLSWDLYKDFWIYWTFGEMSLADAFFTAESNYGYKHLYPDRGLEPGCLSALVPEGTVDYCQQSFSMVQPDQNEASTSSGHFYSQIIGAPKY